MKNLEKGLTRRALLGSGLKTIGGIFLLGAPTLLSSCAVDENKHYRFDLSRLNSWQADLFLQAGNDYWRINEGRDDTSRNKVLFGEVPKGKIAYASWKSKYSSHLNINGLDQEKIYTFTVTLKHDENWVNCDIEGESGQDLYRVFAHE